MSEIDETQLTFVIQGPIFKSSGINHTSNLAQAIRALFPDSQIVFSTWESPGGENIECDALVTSKDPGAFLYNSHTEQLNNVNRQIISTLAGLKAVRTRYCIKLRSDLLIYNRKILSVLSALPEVSPEYSNFLSSKVAVLNVTSVNPRYFYKLLHHPCDWLYAGLTSDLIRIWDIPVLSAKDATLFTRSGPAGYDHFLPRYRTETFIWSSFLKKSENLKFNNSYDFSQSEMKYSEKLFANLLIICSQGSVGVRSAKHKISFQSLTNMYTVRDWKSLLNAHSSRKEFRHRISWDLESGVVTIFRLLLCIRRGVLSLSGKIARVTLTIKRYIKLLVKVSE